MKKLLFILMLIFNTLQSFACEKDSIFDIHLQHDSSSQSLNVEFKNITNDTITLISQFDIFFNEIRKSPGFRIIFYRIVVAEEDVKGLLWLTKIKIDPK